MVLRGVEADEAEFLRRAHQCHPLCKEAVERNTRRKSSVKFKSVSIALSGAVWIK